MVVTRQLTNGPELQDDLFVGAALGVELTPWLGLKLNIIKLKVM
jgi:OOP family OmpA-OmpF porin